MTIATDGFGTLFGSVYPGGDGGWTPTISAKDLLATFDVEALALAAVPAGEPCTVLKVVRKSKNSNSND